ncbi:MAG TPA: hypothetical protein VMU93_08610 [Caulobacteraceae bacterium]|nr:hypothetical protein [Caulobacteraceae bacterium]
MAERPAIAGWGIGLFSLSVIALAALLFYALARPPLDRLAQLGLRPPAAALAPRSPAHPGNGPQVRLG